MSLTIQADLEAKLRSRAKSAGLSVEAYLDGMLSADEQAEEELDRLALEGLLSGEPAEADPEYWEALHRRLEERLHTVRA